MVLWRFIIHYIISIVENVYSYESMIARSVQDLNADLGVSADLDLSLRPRLNSENLDLSSSSQKSPNCGLQKISYQRKRKSILTIWWMKLRIYNYRKKNIPFLLQKCSQEYRINWKTWEKTIFFVNSKHFANSLQTS